MPALELDELNVRYVLDPAADRYGHDILSPYVERYWLPTLGPSSICLLRWFAHNLDPAKTTTVALKPLGAQLGLSFGQGTNSPLWRTIVRISQFHAAQLEVGAGALLLRAKLPNLSERQVHRLPANLWLSHELDRAKPVAV